MALMHEQGILVPIRRRNAGTGQWQWAAQTGRCCLKITKQNNSIDQNKNNEALNY